MSSLGFSFPFESFKLLGCRSLHGERWFDGRRGSGGEGSGEHGRGLWGARFFFSPGGVRALLGGGKGARVSVLEKALF